MAGGTRSSARIAAGSSSSPPSAKAAGVKRKAEDADSGPSTSSNKRGRPKKQQQTLEEAIDGKNKSEAKGDGDDKEEGNSGNNEKSSSAQNVEMKDVDQQNTDKADNKKKREPKYEENNIDSKAGAGKDADPKADDEEVKESEADGEKHADTGSEGDALKHVKADENEAGVTTKGEKSKGDQASLTQNQPPAVEEDKKREEAQPSNVLEKGIIYFFTRARVNVDDPTSVQDLARSYFVLRPLPAGGKLTEGAVQDVGNNRLLELPKKVWPKSGKDRFMTFVAKAKTSMDTLKEEFFSGSEYTTKTTGTRHSPPVEPVGEGVYVLVNTGGGRGTSHLAYMLTIPQEVSEVQKDLGIAAKGSFVVSIKNPESSGPANAQLPQSAEYPKEMIEEFAGRAWGPVEPKHLDYANAQMLLIGEDFESSSNLNADPKDEKDDRIETPQEELERLEEEDGVRVQRMAGNDTVFADLGISSKEYPKVQTTW